MAIKALVYHWPMAYYALITNTALIKAIILPDFTRGNSVSQNLLLFF